MELWASADCIDVIVSAFGFRPETLQVSGAKEITLTPALPVRIVLRTDGTLPEVPFGFGPSLKLDGENVGTPVASAFFSDHSREVLLFVSAPGRIQVTWHLLRFEKNFSYGGPVLPGHEVMIEVLDQAGEQVFFVDLDGDALSELTKKPQF